MAESIVHVPYWPLVFPVFWGAFGVFLLIVARHLRVIDAVRADGLGAFEEVPRRTAGLVRYTILQSRMFRERRVGVMHLGLFLGSTILLLGNINMVTGGLMEAVLHWPLDGLLWKLLLFVQSAVAIAALLAVAYATFRRLVTRPRRLLLTRTSLVILLFIFLVVSTEVLAQTFEVVAYGDLDWAFLANALAVPLAVVGEATAETLFGAFWWAHIIILSAFLIYIPFNKHFHVYTSFVNVWLRKLEPRGALPAMDLESEAATFGIRTLADLSRKDLLDGFTCTECGRCEEACPAHRSGKPLNPRSLIMGVRRMSEAAERGVDLIPNSPIVRETYGLGGITPDADRLAAPIIGDAISYDAVWDCVTCGACVEACPVLIEHVDKIVGLRRNLVLEDSKFPPELTAAFRGMESVANPWGQPPSARLDWAKGLPFDVPVAADVARAGGIADLDVMYWVGCAAAFDDRARRVARAFVTCLDAAGVRFAVLGQEEACTGDPARRMGNEYVFQMLAMQNVDTLAKYGPPRIVTACPHCFNTLANEYGQFGGHYTVVHHSTYLSELIAGGRLATLAPEGAATRTVTFHDSCYLARYNGVIAQPRAVLGAVDGLELREMAERGRQTSCCGAGGGRMWMEESRGTRINSARAQQAVATGATTVATSCPFCLVMLRDGLAELTTGPDDAGVTSLDIAEILAEVATPGPVAALGGRRPGRELPMVSAGRS